MQVWKRINYSKQLYCQCLSNFIFMGVCLRGHSNLTWEKQPRSPFLSMHYLFGHYSPLLFSNVFETIPHKATIAVKEQVFNGPLNLVSLRLFIQYSCNHTYFSESGTPTTCYDFYGFSHCHEGYLTGFGILMKLNSRVSVLLCIVLCFATILSHDRLMLLSLREGLIAAYKDFIGGLYLDSSPLLRSGLRGHSFL